VQVNDAVVLFEELPAGNGKRVGVVQLNAEKSLNSLSLAMTDLIQARITEWERDRSIACVFMHAAGEKAFCAGGDIRQLYDSMVASGKDDNPYAMDFFKREYELDYHLHTYRKPIVVWATGIVMGGGMGLVNGPSHRVVTENTRMAMPEVGIGLFPDVGGTFFLNHAPGRSGLFAGLTGVSMNAADALMVGLGDRFVASSQRDAVLRGLQAVAWSADAGEHAGQVSHLLREFEVASRELLPVNNVAQHFERIQQLTDQDSLDDIVAAILDCGDDDPWLQSAVKGLRTACPMSLHLVYQQLRRGKYLSLPEVFRLEYVMSTNCARYGNFQEGVRALIVDKDRKPAFMPPTLAQVTAAMVAEHFRPIWGDAPHPLAHLQEQAA